MDLLLTIHFLLLMITAVTFVASQHRYDTSSEKHDLQQTDERQHEHTLRSKRNRKSEETSNKSLIGSVTFSKMIDRNVKSNNYNGDTSIRKRKRNQLGGDDKPNIKRQFIPGAYGRLPYFQQQYLNDQEEPRMFYEKQQQKEGPCTSRPCHHDGICVRKRRGYFCSCAPGFIGTHCEARKECDAETCKNGGTCTEEAQGRHLCTCAVGFRGENCEETSKCHPNPCRNGGECSETEDAYTCLCKEGYRGKDCEDLNQCDPNPCKNAGTCFEQNSDFFCNCPAMYRGKTCEVVSECSTARCMNGGSCRDSSDGFKCKCPYGFFGRRCEVTACQPNPCLNEGMCSMLGSQHTCQCAKGYSGKHCEVQSPCGLNICQNGGTCVDSMYTNSRYGFACVCPRYYDGILCEKHLPAGSADDDDDGERQVIQKKKHRK